MQWENLTAKDFPKAVKKAKGVCVIALSCIEKHGDHLPLGTDMFAGLHLAREAAKVEPAVVFPPYYFTQIQEAKHQPGTVAVSQRVMWDLLLESCNEISRNGMKKIILLNAHGGNGSFLAYFTMMMLEKERDYVVYSPPLEGYRGEENDKLEEIEKKYKPGKKLPDMHGGHKETSIHLSIVPLLVKMKDVAPGQGVSKGRLDHLPGIATPISWYADFPNHYSGDAAPATKQAGDALWEMRIRAMARIIREVKADKVAPRLMKEFYSRTKHNFLGRQ